MTETMPSIGQAHCWLVYRRLLAVIKAELEDLSLDVSPESIVSMTQVRNAVIRKQYDDSRREGCKAEALYCELAEQYGLSYKTIWDIVHHPLRGRPTSFPEIGTSHLTE